MKPPTRHCEECAHFNHAVLPPDHEFGPLRRGAEDPTCSLGHALRFFCPRSPVDNAWGWRRACPDFERPEPTRKEPLEP